MDIGTIHVDEVIVFLNGIGFFVFNNNTSQSPLFHNCTGLMKIACEMYQSSVTEFDSQTGIICGVLHSPFRTRLLRRQSRIPRFCLMVPHTRVCLLNKYFNKFISVNQISIAIYRLRFVPVIQHSNNIHHKNHDATRGRQERNLTTHAFS